MKKLIALIAAVSVFVGMSATTFATTTPSVGTSNGVDAITQNADGSFKVDASKVTLQTVNGVQENIANNNQTTIVVVKGDGTDISTTSIQYINQSNETSFDFVAKDDTTLKKGTESVTLTALIGGDGITKTTAGTIVYAVDKVEYAVTFVYVNEEDTLTTISSTTTTDGKVAQPADPDIEGYDFDGWYADADYTKAFDFTAALSADTTVYAKLTEEAAGGEATDEYVLTFLNADGSTFAEISTVNGSVVLPETEPEKAKSGSKRYAFIGWYTDTALTTKIADATITENQNVHPKFSQIAIYGDANATGTVDGIDAILIQQKVKQGTNYKGNVGTAKYPDFKTSSNKDALYGDANGNGAVDGIDAILIQQKVKQGTNYKGNVGTDMVVVKD